MKTLGLMKRAMIQEMTADTNPSLKMAEFITDKAQRGLIDIKNGSIVDPKNIELEGDK